MFKKIGRLEATDQEKKPILVTPENKAYEVSYMMAFVWDRLDGSTSTPEIVTEVNKFGDFQDIDLNSTVNEMCQEMEKVGLAATI